MSQPVKDYLFNARNVVMNPATSPLLLIDVIRQGDMISPGTVSWVAVCAVVQMCIIGGRGDELKAVIIRHYNAASERSDHAYMRKLSMIAQMFGEHAFEHQIPPPPRTEREQHAIDMMMLRHRHSMGEDQDPPPIE